MIDDEHRVDGYRKVDCLKGFMYMFFLSLFGVIMMYVGGYAFHRKAEWWSGVTVFMSFSMAMFSSMGVYFGLFFFGMKYLELKKKEE